MSGQQNEPGPIDHATQLAKYRHRERLIIYVSGGLGGVALIGPSFVSSSPFIEEYPWLRATFVTIVVAAGGFLGMAYGAYENAAEQLSRRIDREENLAGLDYDPTADAYRPANAELFYRIGTILVPAAAVWLLIVVWLEALCDAFE
jgi:hypothetical protein